MTHNFAWRLLVLLALVIAAAPLACAKEDPKAKAEAELIAKEDDEARRLGGENASPLVHYYAKGKLNFYAPDDPERKNDVYGVFATDKGTYIVKVPNPTVLKLIEPYDRKETTLIGKLRGEGKYFIVEGIGGGGAPPVAKSNKKRI